MNPGSSKRCGFFRGNFSIFQGFSGFSAPHRGFIKVRGHLLLAFREKRQQFERVLLEFRQFSKEIRRGEQFAQEIGGV